METQPKTSAKDFFINLGAIVALYTTVISLVNLLFRVINKAYPQITNGYNYFGSQSISWPVATIIVFFPIFILLMWFLGKDYQLNPEKQNSGIHRWLTYITLFVAGLAIAGDLIAVLYYFIDGQEITTGFILKILVLLVIASGVFSYYLFDVLGKLTTQKRNIYRIVALVVIIASIIWGFSVLGSPRTQQLLKHDQQKASDLQYLDSQIRNYYANKGTLPKDMEELSSGDYYAPNRIDVQTKKPYVYKKTSGTTYNLCADFNKASDDKNALNSPYYYEDVGSWSHPAGTYCFTKTINPNIYYKTGPSVPIY